ncbi:hypothetical protein SAMN02745131_02924 [Flavisolibacter ginsengisoli DSM 18119]|jgi:hypothetical protein|uniref:Uncharacterized protein n=1 Tax=Flavisolibacter ginsengisoli DSM 18119 TaxID=1121884 RepID=A0A1M5CFY6_9BACT|nr:hypothetical protein SAMN02745131_02924 [Flavisolibacter ginsengisoli DSM 18119]
MKGKNVFTSSEITELKQLIHLRTKSEPSAQKAIRDKMRKIGFYGKDDWGITDMKPSDLDSLVASGRIKVIGGLTPFLNQVATQSNKAAKVQRHQVDAKSYSPFSLRYWCFFLVLGMSPMFSLENRNHIRFFRQ